MNEDRYAVTYGANGYGLEDFVCETPGCPCHREPPRCGMALDEARTMICEGLHRAGETGKALRLSGLSDVQFLADWGLEPDPFGEDQFPAATLRGPGAEA